jgi:hypothetical protein
MANPSIQKRQKERERQDRQKAKEEKRKQRKEEKVARVPGEHGEDPDIAGIVPGPQPVPDELIVPEERAERGEESRPEDARVT